MKKTSKYSQHDYESQDLEDLSPNRIYHLINGVVTPRPIAFVTTENNGVVNAAPFSWFNAVCTDPPIVSLAIGKRQGALKDTARNILKHKEFVINICHTGLAAQISKCAGDYESSISEVELADLDLLRSDKVGPPRIANSMVHLECRLEKSFEIGNSKNNFILGCIVKIHLHKNLLNEKGHLDVMKLDPLARLNGNFYASLTGRFEIERG